MSRAKLDFGDDDLSTPAPPAIPVETIKDATRRAGFHETPRTSVDPVPPPAPPRRTRLKTGRTQQFATRLRPETAEGFYKYADDNGITVAETLERALKALVG